MTELEITAEDYLVEQIEKAGGWAPKLVIKHGRGFPDRTIFLNGETYLVEVKREKHGQISGQQNSIHTHLKKCGKNIYVLWGSEGVELFLKSVLWAHGPAMPVCGFTKHLGLGPSKTPVRVSIKS